MKNIIFLHYRLDHGGIDRVATLLADGFARHGDTVTLLLFCRNGVGEDALLPLLDKRVQIIYLGEKRSSRTKDLLRLLPSAARWIQNNPADVIISTCNHMNWIALLTVKLSGIKSKIALKTTNPIIRKFDSGIYAILRKWSYQKAFQRADITLALSNAERDELQQEFPKAAEKIVSVINPYVTDAMLTESASKTVLENIPHGHKIILAIGRYEPQKRMQLLLYSFAALKREDCHLIILGDGDQKQECEELVKSSNLEDRVTMPGFVNDVTPWLHAADLYVMTSLYEGLPAVILEALAANCPVLSTDCFPAAREILSPLPSCGILESIDPNHIAQAISDALDNDASYNLRKSAEIYSIENGITDHIRKINMIL